MTMTLAVLKLFDPPSRLRLLNGKVLLRRLPTVGQLQVPRPEDREWLEATFRAEVLALDPQVAEEFQLRPGDEVFVDAPYLALLDYDSQLYLGRKVDLLAKLIT